MQMKVALSMVVAAAMAVSPAFAAKKQDFGDGWHDLIANVVPFSEAGTGEAEGPVRSAHAWLLPPQLGAA